MFSFRQRKLARYYEQKQYEIYFNEHDPVLCMYYFDADDGTPEEQRIPTGNNCPLFDTIVYEKQDCSFWKELYLSLKSFCLSILGRPLKLIDVEQSRLKMPAIKYARCVILTKNLDLLYRYLQPSDEPNSVNTPPNQAERDALIDKVSGISKWPCNLLGYKRTKTFKGFLGAAMSQAIEGNVSGCNDYIQQAIKYYKHRSEELVRVWRFVYSTIQMLIFIALIFLFHTYKDSLCDFLTLPHITSCEVYYQAVTGGLLGAYFSILLKKDKFGDDLFSGKKVYIYECLIRFTVSIISGIIIAIFLRSALAPAFIANIHSNKDIFIVALIAGFCERFLPSMIASAGGIQYPEDTIDKTKDSGK